LLKDYTIVGGDLKFSREALYRHRSWWRSHR